MICMKRLLFIFIMCLFFTASFSQQLILGTVRDGFLKVPLPEARVTLLSADSVIIQDSIKISVQKKEGERWGSANFVLTLPKKTCTYLLHATLDGYEDAWQTLSVKAEIDDAYGLDNPLELRRIRQRTLSEVTVKATKLKMFYKGDTLVYDATAFKMPDGSMLDDLIRQMPNSIMNDNGEIFVNGRKIDELLLGSRSFMGGNKKVLLENLPYYTVKNLKVYEKESDRSFAVGYDIDKKKYVMDVNLKDAYRNGYIGNVEMAGGTKNRWLGRAFLLNYTDKLRFTLYANANNVNEKRHIGESSCWKPEKMPQSQLTTKRVAGEIDFQSKDSKIKENFMLDLESSKDFEETKQRHDLFLDGSTPYSILRLSNTSRANRLFAKNSVNLNIPEVIYTDLGVEFIYNKYRGNSESISEDYLDAINTRLQSSNFNNGHSLEANVNGFISPRADNILRPFVIFYGFKHHNNYNETARGYITEQYENPSTTTQYIANNFHNAETAGNIHLTWSCEIGKYLHLELQNRQELSRKYEHDYLYHPDTLSLPSQLDALLAITDPRNSYKYNYRKYSNAPTLYMKWRKEIPGEYMKMEYLIWDIRIPCIFRTEHLTYIRNYVTQNKKRTSYTFAPSLSFRIHPTKKRGEQLQVQLSYEQDAAPLFDLLDYKDDATPQIVKLGNPKLKGSASSTARATFTDWENKHKGQQYHISGQFTYFHRQVAQSVTFNPNNSQYTYQPQNVNGAYKWSAEFGFTRFLDKLQRWSCQNSLEIAYNHFIDHALQTGMKESSPNAVNTLTLHDGIWFQYQNKNFNIKATGDIRWRHSVGKMLNFSNLNALDYQYGMSTWYTIPNVKTTFSIDWNMYCRQGYGSKSLNTNDFVINASIAQSFLKGKVIISAEAFDIFHQLSTTQYVVNAQGRTETWKRSLPNYLMLHVVYHFNHQPKY